MCVTWPVPMGWAFVVVQYTVTNPCLVWRCDLLHQNSFVWRCDLLYQNCFVYELRCTAVYVQEGLLNVTWYTQTPFLCSPILCTHCTLRRIVSYENWFPVPSTHRSPFTVQYRYFCYFLRNLNFLRVFEKCSNTKFHENPSSGSRIVPCGKTGGRKTDRQTDRQTWRT
jgi:hypothetical protein